MARDRSAPPEGDYTRAVLEAAIAALPPLFRAESSAILLASAERNALRGVARRNLSEPQVQALVELLTHHEVGALLGAGRPFLPRAADGVSPDLRAQLSADGWPDLIAVPLPGMGRPVGALVMLPEGDGRWGPAKIDAAMRSGALVAASLRAAVRASEGERRRRQVASLLERLPLIGGRTADHDDALNQIVAGVGEALGLSHCLGVLLQPETLFAEFCQAGATPIGPPAAPAEHPLWRLLGAGSLWSYDASEASPADRAATAHLLGGLHPRAALAVPVQRAGSLTGFLLLLQADRHRRFTDEERQFAHAAAVELAGYTEAPDRAGEPPAGPGPTPALTAAQDALAAASTPEAIVRALRACLAENGEQIEAVVLARWDQPARRIVAQAALLGEHTVDLAALGPAPAGDDLLSAALESGDLAGGGAARALPRPWRSVFRERIRRNGRALLVPLVAGDESRGALLVIAAGEAALAEAAPSLRLLAPTAALSLSRADLIARASHRERRLTALNSVLLATASASDVVAACGEVSAAISRDLPGVDLVNVWLLDETGHTLHRVATAGVAVAEDLISRSLALDRDTGVGRAVRARSGAVWQHDDPRRPDGVREFMERAGLRTLAIVPMRTARGVSGTLSLGSLRRRTYEPEELAFLDALAGQLGNQLDLVLMRERAEGERRWLLSLVETLPEGLLVMDGQGTVHLYSPMAERVLGVPLEGRTAGEIFGDLQLLDADGEPYPTPDLPFLRALAGEASVGVEVALVRAAETETRLLVNCRPIRDTQGAVSGAICVFQDLTPLHELTTLKSDFVNTVSHELRTPITTIRGGALTLLKRRQFLDEQTQNDLLNDITEEAERLHLLVEDLLSLTRSRSGINVSPEPVLLHRLVNRVILELGGRVGGHALLVTVPTDLPPVDVDPAITQKVIRNLLENAVKFSPRGQQIEIAAEQQGAEVVVSVLDRGSGVPPEDLDRVFEPFYRPASTVRSGAQGAGLGLAVCRRLVEMQGGRIWAEAREGGGAAFRFTLPPAEE